jgi:hypothetical protein
MRRLRYVDLKYGWVVGAGLGADQTASTVGVFIGLSWFLIGF